jgi:D-aminopeptidase
MRDIRSAAVILFGAAALFANASDVIDAQERPRARDLGIIPGIFTPGTANAITDVRGVLVGQVTIREGDSVRTGVTAILPHAGNLYRDRTDSESSWGSRNCASSVSWKRRFC